MGKNSATTVILSVQHCYIHRQISTGLYVTKYNNEQKSEIKSKLTQVDCISLYSSCRHSLLYTICTETV